MKRIIVSVTNDLAADNRVFRMCATLYEMGIEVKLIGRRLPASLPLAPRPYVTRRMRLLFTKGPLFYAEFNLRLFFYLLFSRFDMLLANDLDTLPANFLVARIRRKELVYDSHEYFTQVPELIGRPTVQGVWEWLEKQMVPHLKYAVTVCESIAAIYQQQYQVPFRVVRNLPVKAERKAIPAEKRVNESRPIILYQGALNVGRGLEQAIRAMELLDGALLVLAGSGDIEKELYHLVTALRLEERVKFAGRLPVEELGWLTRQASLGISIEEDLGLNYRYALPNKLFDYIQARVPVVVSNLPEMKRVVEYFRVGLVSGSHEPAQLAGIFREALFNESRRVEWQKNLEIAAAELTWEKEKEIVCELFGPLLEK